MSGFHVNFVFQHSLLVAGGGGGSDIAEMQGQFLFVTKVIIVNCNKLCYKGLVLFLMIIGQL